MERPAAARAPDASATLIVNGTSRTVHADGQTPLLFVLRGDLGLTGARPGCGLGQCGTCTVLVDGEPVTACNTPVASVAGRSVETVENLAGNPLHPLVAAFVEEQAGQCAYCIPGIIMRAKALLAAEPAPDRARIAEALDGALCRCGSHQRIVRAVERAAGEMRA
jgi:nicotinate dehydrogenase subunit A